jgi:hypothetical protein
VTSGVYGTIRHPSYLGLLVNALGWTLAFRSGVGVLLTALMIPVILARIRAEETLLRAHFGAEYEAYRQRNVGLPRRRDQTEADPVHLRRGRKHLGRDRSPASELRSDAGVQPPERRVSRLALVSKK